MAFLQIKSDNPNFSWAIVKNPTNKLPLIKSVRKGKMFGWFSSSDKYNVLFRDSPTEVSYQEVIGNTEFEYLDISRYVSCQFPIDAINNLFASALKKEYTNPDDDLFADVLEYESSITIGSMNIKDLKYIEIFQQYISGFEITATNLSSHNYTIEIKTKQSIKKLLNYTMVFCLFNVLKSGVDVDIEPKLVAKYIDCVKEIDPPYFVRYVFKVNMLRNKGLFDMYSKRLSETKHHKSVNMVYSNTSGARIDAIKKMLKSATNIIDVGCGSGSFFRALTKNMPENGEYIAVDIDSEELSKAKNMAQKVLRNKQINFSFYDSIDTLSCSDLSSHDMLLVEVIEHMTMADAKYLVKKCLSMNPKRVVVTTPNKLFNQFYFDDDETMRHDDHHFELSPDEFDIFIKDCISPEYTVQYVGIGDSVEGIHTTQGCILELKNDKNNEHRQQSKDN